MKLTGDIIFSAGILADTDIWRLNLETRRLTQLTSGTAANEQPRWSPSGHRIAFVSNRDNGIPKLFLMDDQGGHLTQLITSDRFCDGVCWFPDGTRLLFSSNFVDPNEIDLFSLPIDKPDSPNRLMTAEGIESNPSISPDGHRVLYSVASSPSEVGLPRNYDIWEYDFMSGQRRQMTDHLLRDFSPRYAPDGRRFAFISQRNPTQEGDLVDAVTNLQHLVQSKAPMDEIDQGIRAVQRLEQSADLWLMDRNHPKSAKRLTSGQLISSSFSWSPDSRYICYAAAEAQGDGVSRLHIVDTHTGDYEELDFDRSPLKVELKTTDEDLLNKTWLSRLIPDILERGMIPRIVHGSEAQPDWRRI